MHYAKYENSLRLQRVAAFLSASPDQYHTTRDIIRGADVCAVNSCITELRANGFVILSRPVAGGGGAWEYRMANVELSERGAAGAESARTDG